MDRCDVISALTTERLHHYSMRHVAVSFPIWKSQLAAELADNLLTHKSMGGSAHKNGNKPNKIRFE
jgi:hypothetical protein